MNLSVDPFERWKLRKVINAAGTLTRIGGSRVRSEVASVVSQLLGEFVDIDELQSVASGVISDATGAEAGCVTDCSAAGITLSVAAAITGNDLAAIESLPRVNNLQNKVAIQMGHMINYGGPIAQSIALAGAEVVVLGSAAQCETWHLHQTLEAGCAAAVYVVSHHTVREGELPLDLFTEICSEYAVPVIVDMASEYDLRGAIDAGATAAIYSGHKFLGGVTSGIVAGRREFVQSVYLQHNGIGRCMTVGKEGIAGAMAALETWSARDPVAIRNIEDWIIKYWQTELDSLQGVNLTLHEDWTGNPITRIKLTIVPDAAGLYAWELSSRLAARATRIMVRDDLVEHNEIYLDPCNLDITEARLVTSAIKEELLQAHNDGDGCFQSWSDNKRVRAQRTTAWPQHHQLD